MKKKDLICDWRINVEDLDKITLDKEAIEQYGCKIIRIMIYKADNGG